MKYHARVGKRKSGGRIEIKWKEEIENMYKMFDENVVVVVFQSTFNLEMYQNNIFFIFKNYFWY
jgi:hypothetical protein